MNDEMGEGRLRETGDEIPCLRKAQGRSKDLREAIYLQWKALSAGTSLPFVPSVLPCAHKKVKCIQVSFEYLEVQGINQESKNPHTD